MQQEDNYEQVSLGDSTVKEDAQGDVAVPTSTPAASVSERSVSPKREEADHHRQQQHQQQQEQVSYPKVEADDDPAQLAKEREAWNSSKLPQSSSSSQTANPYIATSPLPSSDNKGFVYNVRDVLGKWGKKVGDATKRAEDFTGDFWQHLKTGPSIADTAMERIAQGTKVLTEGGYEKIFRQSFETSPEEKLEKTFACYLSTTAGPVIGTLYLSTEKLAFCSDEPLSYKSDGDKTEWSFYKVVLPLHQLKFANPSANRNNPAEKYIQVVSTDSHEFWFMGFVNYEKALKSLQSLVAEDKL